MNIVSIRRTSWLPVATCLLMFAASAFSSRALQAPNALTNTPSSSVPEKPSAAPDTQAVTESQKRQAELASDTAKLQVLATELKAEMDKSSKDMLSLSVMRKADEIEKLARKVRAEMRASLAN